jgi:ATP-dependent RNA helicase DeaD
MGFADDVEWILGEVKSPHQTALFSATMSPSIQKIAQRYLKDAKKIQIKSQTNTVEAIEQCYITVSNRNQKLDVLTRLLEAEDNQAVIIFTRTKTESTELAERLQARGHGAAALNGDMSQNAREKTINRLKKGDLDILIATDVAARGIDVERVTHVINYDIPYDVDAYVHRIGRTGRAGRAGKAILFVTPREMRLFKDIEHHINKSIKRIDPPSLKEIREKRISQLGEKIAAVMLEKKAQLTPFIETVIALTDQHACSPKEIAAALMFLSEEESTPTDHFESAPRETERPEKRHYGKRKEERRSDRFSRGGSGPKGAPNRSRDDRFERSDRPKFERTEKSDRPKFEKTDHPKFDRKERSEKFERSERPRFEKSERPKFERSERTEKFERSERPTYDRSERSEKSARPKFEKSERPKFEKSEKRFSDSKSSKPSRDFDPKKTRSNSKRSFKK